MDAQLELAREPTFSIDYPEGCQADYTDPRDRQIRLPQTSNGWDAVLAISDGLLGAAITLGPWYGVTYLGVEAVQAVSDARGPTAIQHGDRIGRDQAGRDIVSGGRVDGDQIGGDLNSGRVDSPDRTHDPTVVTQPEPVVVKGGSSAQ